MNVCLQAPIIAKICGCAHMEMDDLSMPRSPDSASSCLLSTTYSLKVREDDKDIFKSSICKEAVV